ncbi:hypothetical protein [Desulfosarcina sp.]|uniref:hypothetical protein n=1 Tax=Desulfosarcina sp. TaxID=2027861 RepID=UPI003568C016
MQSTVNWNDYDTEAMVRGDRDYLWYHIKPHQVFQSAEQMIIVEGKGLRVTDIRGREVLDATAGGVWSVMVGHGRESRTSAALPKGFMSFPTPCATAAPLTSPTRAATSIVPAVWKTSC